MKTTTAARIVRARADLKRESEYLGGRRMTFADAVLVLRPAEKSHTSSTGLTRTLARNRYRGRPRGKATHFELAFEDLRSPRGPENIEMSGGGGQRNNGAHPAVRVTDLDGNVRPFFLPLRICQTRLGIWRGICQQSQPCAR